MLAEKTRVIIEVKTSGKISALAEKISFGGEGEMVCFPAAVAVVAVAISLQPSALHIALREVDQASKHRTCGLSMKLARSGPPTKLPATGFC